MCSKTVNNDVLNTLLLCASQGKGMTVGQLDVERQELESLRAQTIIDGSKIRQLEAAVDLKEAEILKLAKVKRVLCYC